MAKVNWREILGWANEQLEELRFSGFSFLREGHYKKALIFFEALVILDPDSIYDHQTLGALHLQMGNAQKALKALDRAILLDPIDEPSLLNRAKALLMNQRKAEAIEILNQLQQSEDSTISGDASALLYAHA